MKPWSKTVSACVNCNTTKNRHMAKGLCNYCYLKEHHSRPENIEKIKKQKEKHYLDKQKPLAKSKRESRYFDGKRQLVLDRDDNKCRKCGDIGSIIHHIDGNGRGSKSPNNDMNNLITLCRACHIDEHRHELLDSRFIPGRDGWARNYDCCVLCSKTDSEHNSKGRCARCMAGVRRKSKI